jgi:hypothetical protein
MEEADAPSSKVCKYSLLFSSIYTCAWPVSFKVVFVLHELDTIRWISFQANISRIGSLFYICLFVGLIEELRDQSSAQTVQGRTSFKRYSFLPLIYTLV